MGIPERSRERVEEYLAGLEETYGSFPVNQTTVSLPEGRYASVRERGASDHVQAYVEIRNEAAEILCVTADGEDLPGVRAGFDAPLEPLLRSAVADLTGIECSVDDLELVTIAGIRNAEDADCGTVFRIAPLFSGHRVSGTLGPDAEWRATAGTERSLVG